MVLAPWEKLPEGLIGRKPGNCFPAYEALQLLYIISRRWSRWKLRFTSPVRKRKRVPSSPTVWAAANPSNFGTPVSIHFAVPQKGRNQWGGAVPWNVLALCTLSNVNEYRSHTQARPLSILFFVVLLLNINERCFIVSCVLGGELEVRRTEKEWTKSMIVVGEFHIFETQLYCFN